MMCGSICLVFLFSGQHILPWSFRNIRYRTVNFKAMKKAFQFFHEATWYAFRLPETSPRCCMCPFWKQRACFTLYKCPVRIRREKRSKHEAESPRVTVRSPRSTNALADSRKSLRLIKTLPVRICSFNLGCSSRYNPFLLINFSLFLFCKTIMCTLPTVWQLYRCKVLSTAVHCTANLFMIWHRRSAMSMTIVQHLGALN